MLLITESQYLKKGFGDIKINKGYQMALNDIKKHFTTPEQAIAKDILESHTPAVLKELKKLL